MTDNRADILDLGDAVFDQRRDLLTELGWEKPAAEAAAIYEAEFPEAVALEKKTSQLNR